MSDLSREFLKMADVLLQRCSRGDLLPIFLVAKTAFILYINMVTPKKLDHQKCRINFVESEDRCRHN